MSFWRNFVCFNSINNFELNWLNILLGYWLKLLELFALFFNLIYSRWTESFNWKTSWKYFSEQTVISYTIWPDLTWPKLSAARVQIQPRCGPATMVTIPSHGPSAWHVRHWMPALQVIKIHISMSRNHCPCRETRLFLRNHSMISDFTLIELHGI